MKQETFEKAQELQTKLQDIESALSRIEKNSKDCNGFPLNFSFCYDEENEALKTNVVNYLKAKKSKLQKEFNNLK